MSDTPIEPKKNLLLEAAQKKAAQLKNGNKPGLFGKDLARQNSFGPSKHFRPTKPGGRNGNGKPS